MKVKYRLTRAASGIHHQAVSALIDLFLTGEFRSESEHFADQLLILRLEIIWRVDVLVGNDQDVGRRLGMDIPKRGQKIILAEDVSGGFTVDDLTEEAERHAAISSLDGSEAL